MAREQPPEISAPNFYIDIEAPLPVASLPSQKCELDFPL